MSTYDPLIATNTLSSSCQPPSSIPGSPTNRVKFSCSHGGKILLRPLDSHLKYVGGETRVISVPRDISLKELMEKLTSMVHGETVLKYQVVSEDLDTLVSVKSDEDVRHMFNEINHHEQVGTPKPRAFLFPANPVLLGNQNATEDQLEQRYIDAINGIKRSNPTIRRESLASSTNSSPVQRVDSYSHLPLNCQNHWQRPHCQRLTTRQSQRGCCSNGVALQNSSQSANGTSIATCPSHFTMRSAPSSPLRTRGRAALA